ncbi:hypothetical protein GQ53DRAFT_808698, partial [Thozetella sp. PMI_491]
MMSKTPRFHSKTRRGCQTCKRRRIKCDLVMPCCGQCVKHGVPCDFEAILPTLAGLANAARNASGLVNNLAARPVTPVAANVPRSLQYQLLFSRGQQSSRAWNLDLQLFSYFTQSSWTSASAPFVLPSFTEILPILALKNRVLMDALLGMCATSLRLGRPDDTKRLATASHAYMARCISSQVRLLGAGLNHANFDAVYLTAVIIAAQTIAIRQCLPPDAVEDLGAGVAYWFHVFRGIRTVGAASPDLFLGSNIATVFPKGGWQNPFVPELEPSTDDPVFKFLIDGLCGTGTRDEEHAAYRNAMAYLSAIRSLPSRPLHMRFLIDARPVFVRCVERGEPVALLLMGVYFGLVKLLAPRSVIDASAERDLGAIERRLDGGHLQLLRKALDIVDRCEV